MLLFVVTGLHIRIILPSPIWRRSFDSPSPNPIYLRQICEGHKITFGFLVLIMNFYETWPHHIYHRAWPQPIVDGRDWATNSYNRFVEPKSLSDDCFTSIPDLMVSLCYRMTCISLLRRDQTISIYLSVSGNALLDCVTFVHRSMGNNEYIDVCREIVAWMQRLRRVTK